MQNRRSYPHPHPNTSLKPAVSISNTSVAPGGTIIANVSEGASGLQEWVALYNAADPDSAYSVTDAAHPSGNWQYLNGTQTQPSVGLSSATLTFIVPTVPGTYNFRYFAQNGFSNRLALSQNFVVTALAGDLNGDRIINSIDFSIMNGAWLTNNATSDLNKDGIVNSLDFSLMNSNWLKTY